jgi:hypothetical protein
MAVLTRKRYVLASDFSMKDKHGLLHRLAAGDELPAELHALLNQREIDVHIAGGLFRPVGWTPPPPQTAEPATPPAPQEIINNLGLPTSGPRGVELRELDKPPSPKDLAACAALGGPTVVIVHRLPDGEAVATLNFGRLMALYSSSMGAR